MSTLPEISVVHAQPASLGDPDESQATPLSTWSPVELPGVNRPTPTTLIVLAVCAGVGALALGGLAGVSTLTKDSEPPPVAVPVQTKTDSSEQRALALLAKPSTERVAFRGSGGSLVLAVGSGGRAAILARGFRTAGRPFFAWIVGSGPSIRAAKIDGAKNAVFLDTPLAPRESVVVARSRPGRITPTTQLVARRD